MRLRDEDGYAILADARFPSSFNLGRIADSIGKFTMTAPRSSAASRIKSMLWGWHEEWHGAFCCCE